MISRSILTRGSHLALPVTATAIVLSLCQAMAQAEESSGAENIIVEENFESLSPGPVAGQGQWTTFPKVNQRSQIPEVAFCNTNDAPQNLGLSSPLQDDGFEISAALRHFESPLVGDETVVMEFDILRRSGDFMQVGFAKGNTPLPGLDIAQGTFVLRQENLQVLAESLPPPGGWDPVLNYGHWYRIRVTWSGKDSTVRVEYKDLTAGEDTFRTFSLDRGTSGTAFHSTPDRLNFADADALFVRMPSAQSQQTDRTANPALESSILDNIKVSKE